MASLEKRGRSFRIAFRYQGIKYARALSTRNEKAAQATLARLEDNLHRLELGTLALPDGGDLASFLLADGRVKQAPTASEAAPTPAAETRTLAALFADFWAKLPAGSLEQSTITGMKIHQRRLEKHFRKDFLIQGLKLTQLQGYVERRSRDEELHGRKVTAVTIKKAIITLRTVWNWGRQHELIGTAFPSKGLKYPKGTEKPPFMTFTEVERRVQKVTPAVAADLRECAFLSLEEIDELLRSVKKQALQPSVYPMFVFAAHTGARRSEMIRSTLGDLDFDNFKHTLAGSKWGKLRGWHIFRHSFCSNCAAKGIDQRIIDAWVGHQTEEMVRRYRHLLRDQQQTAINSVFFRPDNGLVIGSR